MLVTECPHCRARFRAAAEQLNLRQGQVRCGQCQRIFNAFECVVRPPRAQTPADTALLEPFVAPPPPAPQEDVAIPVSLLEDRVWPEPPASEATEEPGTAAPPSEPGDEPAAAAPPSELEDEPAAAAPPSELEDEPAAAAPPSEDALPQGASAAVTAGDTAAPPGVPVGLEAPGSAHRLPARPARAWTLGVVFLVLVLGLQLAYAFRAQLARQYPPLRPALESVCAQAGCRVPWVNDEAALKLEDSEMLEVPGKPGQVSLQARIRNLSTAAQEYPHLELTLTDITGQTAIRRVLRPADYLGPGSPAQAVMAGGSEALLSVRLETGRIRATGYELLLFYP